VTSPAPPAKPGFKILWYDRSAADFALRSETMAVILFSVQLLVTLGVVLLIAYAGRAIAQFLRQPAVIGEIAVGLTAGPIMIAIAGRASFPKILPPDVLNGLHRFGDIGLALFLVGIAHHLRFGRERMPARTIGWITAGAFVIPLLLGGLLAGWLLWSGDDNVRGESNTPAFVLMVAVSLVVTAVPVLARILSDHALANDVSGRLAMASAAVIDAAAWLLLGVALGMTAGDAGDVAISMITLLAGIGLSLLARRGLAAGWLTRFCRRLPGVAAVLLAAATVGTVTLVASLGLTGVVGAFLVGFAVPSTGPQGKAWSTVVTRVSGVGRTLVPVFFVVAGIQVFTKPMTQVPWLVLVLATVLAIVGKIGGGYLGARIAGQPHRTAITVGVLLNTRGLTEIVVLQAGYTAGILPPALFLALVTMALITTAMTGPLLKLLKLTTPATTDTVPRVTEGAAPHD
jgi:Kef-type K+ transport system membrane component KefB